MKILVIGLGVSGEAVVKFLLAKGERVVAVDKNPLKKELGINILPDSADFPLEDIDLVVISPGVSLSHPLVQKAKEKNIEVIGEIELAFRHLQRPAIGITGTNGKTTVTSLVAHALNHSGRKAEALGNIGTPLIAAIDGEGIAVIELSSYQLETVLTPKLSSACILNITPDHLDRYPSLEAYAEAKFLIQKAVIPGGQLVIERKAAETYPSLIYREAKIYDWQTPPFPLPEPIAGYKNHEAENFIAAFYMAERFGVSPQEFLAAFAAFKKPPHRIEFVRELSGTRFWDDSKGTNIDATIRAVEAMKGAVILIAGGVDKGFPYTVWIEPFKDKVKQIFAFGEAASIMVRDLSASLNVTQVGSLAQAVSQAHQMAVIGDNVLLSPGCSSFDMFRDYKDRGEQFKSLVRNLT